MSVRFRRLVGRLAVVLFLGTLGLPMLDLSWKDDFACGSAELGPRHGTDQIETAQVPLPEEHCAICHWMHAVTGAAPRPAVVVVAVARVVVVTLRAMPPPSAHDVRAVAAIATAIAAAIRTARGDASGVGERRDIARA